MKYTFTMEPFEDEIEVVFGSCQNIDKSIINIKHEGQGEISKKVYVFVEMYCEAMEIPKHMVKHYVRYVGSWVGYFIDIDKKNIKDGVKSLENKRDVKHQPGGSVIPKEYKDGVIST